MLPLCIQSIENGNDLIAIDNLLLEKQRISFMTNKYHYQVIMHLDRYGAIRKMPNKLHAMWREHAIDLQCKPGHNVF